jgi:MscS family membrane protein
LIQELNTDLSNPKISEKSVLLSDVKLESFLVTVEYFTESISIADFNIVKQNINLKVLALLEKLQIKIAGRLK